MAGRYVSEIEIKTNVDKALKQILELQKKTDELENKEYKIDIGVDSQKLEKVIGSFEKMLDSLGKGTGDFKQFENLSKELTGITSDIQSLSKAFGKVDDSGTQTLLSSIQSIDKSLSDLSQHILNVNKDFGNIGKNAADNVGQINEAKKATEGLADATENLVKAQQNSKGKSPIDSSSIASDEKSLNNIIDLFNKMEAHLAQIKKVFSDVGDGEEFSPLLNVLHSVDSTIKNLEKTIGSIDDGKIRSVAQNLQLINKKVGKSQFNINIKEDNTLDAIQQQEKANQFLEKQYNTWIKRYNSILAIFNNFNADPFVALVSNSKTMSTIGQDYNFDADALRNLYSPATITGLENYHDKIKRITEAITLFKQLVGGGIDGLDKLFSEKTIPKNIGMDYVNEKLREIYDIKKTSTDSSEKAKNLLNEIAQHNEKINNIDEKNKINDLQQVLNVLNLINESLKELVTSATSFSELLKNGLNVNSSIAEINSLTDKVKELETELAKIKIAPSVDENKSNISLGNELQETISALKQLSELPGGNTLSLGKIMEHIANGAKLANPEVKKLLESLQLLNSEGEIIGTHINEGTLNSGVDLNNNFAIISRNDAIEDIDRLIAKEKEAEQQGIILAKTLASLDIGNLHYDIQELAQGQSVHQMKDSSLQQFIAETQTLCNATDEQILKLYSDAQKLSDLGFKLDLNPSNIRYDENSGFGFIDLELRKINEEAPQSISILHTLTQSLMGFIGQRNRLNWNDEDKFYTEDNYSYLQNMLKTYDRLQQIFSSKLSTPDFNAVFSENLFLVKSRISDIESHFEEMGINIKSTIKDVFQNDSDSSSTAIANEQVSAMEKVETATEQAAQAKQDFVTANENVQSSVDGSKSPLQLEADLMQQIAKDARDAANAKKEFVEANKQVKDSTDDSNDSMVSGHSDNAEPSGIKRYKKKGYKAHDTGNHDNEETVTKKSELGTTLKKLQTEIIASIDKTTAFIKEITDFYDSADNLVKTQMKVVDKDGSQRTYTTSYSQDGDNLNAWTSHIDTQKFKNVEKQENIEASQKAYQKLIDTIQQYSKVQKRIYSGSALEGDIELVQRLEDEIFKLQKEPILTSSQIDESDRKLEKLLNDLDVVEKKQANKNVQNEVNSALNQQISSWKKIESIRKEVEKTDPTNKKRIAELEEIKELYQKQYDEAKDILDVNRDLYNAEKQNEQLNQISLETTAEIIKYKAKQKESVLNSVQSDINSYKSALDSYNKRPIEKQSDDYKQQLAEYRRLFKELTNEAERLKELKIDVISNNELTDFNELKKQLDKTKLGFDKIFKGAAVISVDKVIQRMTKYLNDFTGISKDAKVQIQGLIEKLQTEGINANPEKVLDTFLKIATVEKAAGRECKSFLDILRDKVWYQWVAQIGTYFSFNDIINYIKQGIQTVRELDTAFVEMQKVSDESVLSLKAVQDASFDLANSVGTTAIQMQNSIADFMRIGDSVEEAQKHAIDANTLLQVSEFDNIEDATSALVSMNQAWKDVDTQHINDVLNILGNNMPIATDELASSLQRSAGTLATLGATIEEAAALTVAGNNILQDPDSVAAGKILPEHMVTCRYFYIPESSYIGQSRMGTIRPR